MKCEKCGQEFEKLNVLTFDVGGSDYRDECEVCEYGGEAVVVETSKNWCGYDLDEEEMLDTITCPHCGEYPFNDKEIHVAEIVQIVMFRKDGADSAAD